MKINFKTILIIFFVALLGGAAGTYSVLEIKDKIEDKPVTSTQTESIYHEVTYTNKLETNYSAAISKVINSVVEITNTSEVTSTSIFGQSYTQDSTALGSGVIISSDGYIVTNDHVVSGATKLDVKLQNGDTYEAEIIGSDSKTDLALIKIEANDLAYSNFTDSDNLVLGQEVIAIGNALGKGTSCSNGIISAINRKLVLNNYQMTLLQTNAAVNSGNSGGGLFDLNGSLIGVVNAKTSSSAYTSEATVEGMGYAIPANTVKSVIQDLKEYGYVKNRPTLGVKIYTSSFNEYYNVDGLVVSEVIEGGAAQKAGLQQYDIITAIDGKEISQFSELSYLLDDYNVGDTVNLKIIRNDKEQTVRVTLQENMGN